MNKIERNVTGLWHDEQGSEVTFEVGEGGALNGRFRPGGAAREHDYALRGFTRGELVAFVVSFDRHGTLASWVGHLFDDDGPAISTLWHMALTPPHPERREERWRGTWSGANTFRRGPAPDAKPGRSVSMPLWPA